MTSPDQDPAAVFAAQPSTMSRLRDSIAVQPSAGPGALGAIRTGYAAGRQMATEQPGWATIRPQTGPVGVDFGSEHPSTVDPQGPPVDHTAANAPASQESLDALHQKVSDLQGSVSGMQPSGAGGGSGQSSQQPAPQQQRQAPNVLQQQAEQHQQALAGMLAGHQNLAQTRQNQAAHFQQRQQAAGTVGVKPAGSAIGMSNAYAQTSFFGTQGSANGVSAQNWESARWSR